MRTAEEQVKFILQEGAKHWATKEGFNVFYSPGSPRDLDVKEITKAFEEWMKCAR